MASTFIHTRTLFFADICVKLEIRTTCSVNGDVLWNGDVDLMLNYVSFSEGHISYAEQVAEASIIMNQLGVRSPLKLASTLRHGLDGTTQMEKPCWNGHIWLNTVKIVQTVDCYLFPNPRVNRFIKQDLSMSWAKAQLQDLSTSWAKARRIKRIWNLFFP